MILTAITLLAGSSGSTTGADPYSSVSYYVASGYLVIDKDIVLVTKYQAASIYLSGKIDNYQRGNSVILTTLRPDGEVENHAVTAKKNGEYAITIQLSNDSPTGLYEVKATYRNSEFASGFFELKRMESTPSINPQTSTSNDKLSLCKGTALCLSGKVTKIVDGDTIYLKDYKIRLSLTNTPEKGEKGFKDATYFTKKLCPVGSTITVDQDDKQPYDKYNRVVGKVTCSGKVLNSELLYKSHANILKQYCSKSEFSGEAWAQKYGCETKMQELKQQIPKESQTPSPPSEGTPPPTPTKENRCDPSYPTVCIPPPPPDLDCSEIPYNNFTVLPPDPHNFDGDKDGIGCEKSTSQPPTSVPPTSTKDSDFDGIPDNVDQCDFDPETYNGFNDADGCPDEIPKESQTPAPTPTPPPPTPAPEENQCDPSYPDVCIPPYPPDLDCGEIPYRNFRVLPPDLHRFDGDKDGIGCEK